MTNFARSGALTLAGIAALAATTAVGQGRNYGRPIETVETRAAGALRGSSRCAVGQAPASARKVLETRVASPDEAKRVKMLIAVARKCYPQEWPDFPPTLVRGAIAEVLYLDAYRTTAPKLAVQATPPASFGVVPDGIRGTPEQDVAWTLAAVANCTVFVDAGGVRQLLLVPASVDEETRRFDALRPAIGKCLAKAQADVLKAATFRGYLADALYRRVQSEPR